jgi:hypothetical protein
MALTKKVKIGGSYYKGFELIVASETGEYILDMELASAATVNSLSATPDAYGSGDFFKLEHLNAAGETLAVLADKIFNLGAGIGVSFDFPALEPLATGDKLRLTYSNAAGGAVTVHTLVEYVGIKVTS